MWGGPLENNGLDSLEVVVPVKLETRKPTDSLSVLSGTLPSAMVAVSRITRCRFQGLRMDKWIEDAPTEQRRENIMRLNTTCIIFAMLFQKIKKIQNSAGILCAEFHLDMTEREALLEVPLANVKRFKTEKTVGTSLLSVEIPEASVVATTCNISEEISEHRGAPAAGGHSDDSLSQPLETGRGEMERKATSQEFCKRALDLLEERKAKYDKKDAVNVDFMATNGGIKEVPHDILTVEDACARGGDKKRIAVKSDLSEAEALAPLKRIEVDTHSVLICLCCILF